VTTDRIPYQNVGKHVPDTLCERLLANLYETATRGKFREVVRDFVRDIVRDVIHRNSSKLL
jgi:hypothetical protein